MGLLCKVCVCMYSLYVPPDKELDGIAMQGVCVCIHCMFTWIRSWMGLLCKVCVCMYSLYVPPDKYERVILPK